MFDYREFLMRGFCGAVGKMADYQVILNANGYYEKGVLTEADLAEIQNLIDDKNNPRAAIDIPEDATESETETGTETATNAEEGTEE